MSKFKLGEIEGETQEILSDIEQYEKRKSGLGTLAIMSQVFGMAYGMGNRQHREPHFKGGKKDEKYYS